MLKANVRFHYHECLYLEVYIKSYSYNDKLKLVNKGIYPMASANRIAPSFNKLVLIIFNYLYASKSNDKLDNISSDLRPLARLYIWFYYKSIFFTLSVKFESTDKFFILVSSCINGSPETPILRIIFKLLIQNQKQLIKCRYIQYSSYKFW